MYNDKEEPLNINNHKRQMSLRKKKRINSTRKKRDTTNKLFIKINLILIFVFIISICLMGFYIYKKLNNLAEVKLQIIEKKKEIDYETKLKDVLKDKIKKINSVLDDKEKIVKDINELYIHKEDELNTKKRIYENLKELYDKTEAENLFSMSLDETINNLNQRIKYINKEKNLK